MTILINNALGLSDIVNWLYAGIGAVLTYIFLHRMQMKRERHVMVKDIEVTINELFSRLDGLHDISSSERKMVSLKRYQLVCFMKV